MIRPDRSGGRPRRLSVHWLGHAFLFDAKPAPTYDPSAGLRLLLIAFLLEGIIGPRLTLFSLLQLPLPPVWLRVPILLGLALALVRIFAGLKLSQIGLYRWREWSAIEKSYFLQVFVVANIVFAVVLADRLQMMFGDPSLRWRVPVTLVTSFLWGFHQEVVYRGIVQTELVRRMGAAGGILLGNFLFTFGPLHFYHFFQTSSAFLMFAAIFAIGLFFAVLFNRSGNLWMVASFHGVGDSYMLSTLEP